MADYPQVFTIASSTTTTVTVRVSNPYPAAHTAGLALVRNGTDPGYGTYEYHSFSVGANSSATYTFTNLTANRTYYINCYTSNEYICTLSFGTYSGGGTSGGGSSSGSWSGGSQTKTNTASWNTSTAAGTSVYNTADSCWNYGTVSLISSDSSWYGYSWVWAKLVSVVETEKDVTYTIQQGARTKNIADWPYHGISIKYKDENNNEQTYLNLPATSTGNYWANATYESDSYNYQVKVPFVNTFSIKFNKLLSAAYSREVTIRFYNDHSYWCNLGGMYQWENILKITLAIPKRTKYIAGVRNANGGVATVNNTSPEVYVSSGTSVTYRATPQGECTFKGWYLPSDCSVDNALGYVVNSGASAVSTSATYSKSITADYELIAIFDGYKVPADWTPSTANSNVYVRDGGS